jgi:hypothetical protein
LKSLRILNAVPSFYEIYRLFPHTEQTRYVFEDSYLFKNDQVPTDSEFEILDKDEMVIKVDEGRSFGTQIVISSISIELIGERMRPSSNCIHVYSALETVGVKRIRLIDFNWDWAYYNYDDGDVNVFVNKNYEKVYEDIIVKFQTRDVEFPDLLGLPHGFNVLLDHRYGLDD